MLSAAPLPGQLFVTAHTPCTGASQKYMPEFHGDMKLYAMERGVSGSLFFVLPTGLALAFSLFSGGLGLGDGDSLKTGLPCRSPSAAMASNAFLTCALVRGVMLRPSRPFWPFFGFLAALRVIGERGEAIRNGACFTCTPPFEAGTAT